MNSSEEEMERGVGAALPSPPLCPINLLSLVPPVKADSVSPVSLARGAPGVFPSLVPQQQGDSQPSHYKQPAEM